MNQVFFFYDNSSAANDNMKKISKYYCEHITEEKLLLEVHMIRSIADYKKYDSFLQLLPENPFIKKELLLKETEEANHKICYFTLNNDQKELLVLMPFVYRKIYYHDQDTGYFDIISPYGFTGPLINKGVDLKIMKLFWKKVDEWYLKNNVVTEFIRFNFHDNHIGYSGSIVPILKMVCGKILPENEQWKNFKPKVRNNIRKATNYGLYGKVYHKNIRNCNITEFYNIYNKTMDRHNAGSTYRYSLELFKEYISNNTDVCALAVVYKENKAISAELLLLSEKVVYSFLGGTDNTFFYARPNDFLKLAVINWSRKNGYDYYFLGGGRTEEDSLYNFKKNFFPKDLDLKFFTGRKIINKGIYHKLILNNLNAPKVADKDFFPKYRYIH